MLTESSAEFSPCRRYRYALRRVFGEGGTVLFVGLNPSTADEHTDDPTIRRCLGFARRWGYGTLIMANLYAWRATDPRELKRVREPRGEKTTGYPDRNLTRLRWLALEADLIVAAWGAWPGPIAARPARVYEELAPGTLRPVVALGLTKQGAPRHPLYVKADIEPQPFRTLAHPFSPGKAVHDGDR